VSVSACDDDSVLTLVHDESMTVSLVTVSIDRKALLSETADVKVASTGRSSLVTMVVSDSGLW
jgi:hypothetical protein